MGKAEIMRSLNKCKKLQRLPAFVRIFVIFVLAYLPHAFAADREFLTVDQASFYELSKGRTVRFKMPKDWKIHKNLTMSEGIIFV